jgi:hypothetical protein
MASLASVRTAVKTTLENAISGLRGYDKVAAAVQVPSFVVVPGTADFVATMGRGNDTWEFDLHVLVSEADEVVGQAQLDEYVTGAGAKSIRQAIFTNNTLGLTHTNAHIAGMSAYGVRFEQTEIQHIGATLRLIVHTRGTE